MSGGRSCKCLERDKPFAKRAWRVLAYRCNHSAFNGYRRTPSQYSAVTCLACQASWRTKAGYVDSLKDYDREEDPNHV